ncbi:MAG: dihydrofolate reductase family protein, partial [Fimbriimonadaceae bacterium]
ALIQAGVQRVVFACPDPNPSAKGGADTLRSAGVEVEHLAELEQPARAANDLFLAAYKRHRATITLKAAIGADGRLALPNGDSKWITGEQARKVGHRLRVEMGCVLIGAGTLMKDDPILTARIPGVRNQPIKLVLLDRPLAHCSFRAENLQAIFWDGEQWQVTPVSDARPIGPGQLESLPAALFAQGIIGVLIEGGASTHSRFLSAGLVDRIELFMAPRILGQGKSWCELQIKNPLSAAPGWDMKRIRKLGDDVQLSLRPSNPV